MNANTLINKVNIMCNIIIAILVSSFVSAQELIMFVFIALIAVTMFMMFQKMAQKEVKMDKVFFVGDVHSRVELVTEALRIANGARVIFLGDIFDGPQGPEGVKKCLDLIRAAGAEMVLGNHEIYPLFAKDKADLIRLWSLHYKIDEATGNRVWEEWMELRSMLTEDDMEWLRSRPLWIKGTTNGRKWIAVHAKLPKGRLPNPWVKGSPTMEQIELVDNTAEGETFWAENYNGGHGLAMIGHTRKSKLAGKCQWANAELLDWDAKKGAPGTAAIAEISANVNVRPLSPVGGKESIMALVNRVLGFIALAWALVACSPTAAVADSTNLLGVVKGLFIAGLCVGAGALVNNIVGKFANITALTGKENPTMGIKGLASTARLAVSVITAYFAVKCGTATMQHMVEIENLLQRLRAMAENKIVPTMTRLRTQARCLARRNRWTLVRLNRWLTSKGFAVKFAVKKTVKAAAPVVAQTVEVDPFTTCTCCGNDAFTGGKPVVAPFVCGRCKNDEVYFSGLAKAEAEAARRDAKDLEEHLQVLAEEEAEKEAWFKDQGFFSAGLLAFAGVTTGKDIADALMGQHLVDALQGGPAFLIFGIIAVIGGLALLAWANQEEKINSQNETGEFRLYSGPLMGQNMNNETHNAKEGKMGMIEQSNQVLKAILEKVKGGPGYPNANFGGSKSSKTYGSVLAGLDYSNTALTIIHEGFRKMVIRDLSAEDIKGLEGKFIWKDGNNTVIVRDSQQYEMPNECFKALLTAVVIAGQVPSSKKVVTLQEVNKYFGSILWAKATVVDLQLSQVLVMSKAVAELYDGTVYVSQTFAAQASWSLYAIRRILTAKGLVKGMIIVLPDNYFPAGICVIASETKAHLQLRQDLGKAITMQPQGDGHSGVARTLSMQLWAMIMGQFVGSRRFDAFAKNSYDNAMSKLDKGVESLLAPAEDGEDGRDQLLAEAARKHGFNPVGVFRSYAKSLAESLTKAFNPMKVNLAPFTGSNKALAPEGYPMMLPWMALVDAFKSAGQTAPKWMQEKLAATEALDKKLSKLANGAIPVLVRNLHRLDAAKVNGIRQFVVAAIATRIPTGKTSGIEVLLFDAEEFASSPVDIGANLVGRHEKDVEFWLFPNQETLAFKVASEGGDDDDLYKFLTGTLHNIAVDGLQWRAETLEETEESKAKEKKLRAFFAKFALQVKLDDEKIAEIMAMPFAISMIKGRQVVSWPSLLGIKKKGQRFFVSHEEVREDVISMTEASRDSVDAQMDLFAKVMVANNDSPFTAAIGTVAQSHKFALGILAGHIVLPEHIRHIGRDWALFLVRTILLSDMVDACNKGKGYKQAAEALHELNIAWGWLCYQIAKVEDAKVICPVQYLVSVPPMARDLFVSRHQETYADSNNVQRKPGALLGKLFGYHEALGNAVDALSAVQHDRMEFAATVAVMADAVSSPMAGAPSVEAFVAPIWRNAWVDKGRRDQYLEGLKILAERRAEGKVDFKQEKAFMADLMDATVYAAHADFDREVMEALVLAYPSLPNEAIEGMFRVAKLGMIYVNGFKNLHVPDKSTKILMDKDGSFMASGGVAGYLLPTTNFSRSVGSGEWFVGGSEILIEWMTDPSVIEAVAKRKASSGDLKFVVFTMKTEAFGPAVNGKRPLLYTEEDFNGKTAMEILSMPGVYLASNTGDESHDMQSGFLAAVADDVKKKRTDMLALLKRENNVGREAFAKLTFTELLKVFKIKTVEANVTGTATVETIDIFEWVDAKRNAHAQFYNTFVVVKFGSESDPDGDEIEIEVADAVDETPVEAQAPVETPVASAPVATVAPAPAEKKDKAGLLSRLNRIHNIKESAVVATPAVTPIYRIAFTGHRPEKIGGYNESSPMRVAVKNAIADALKRAIAKYGETHEIIVVTGGALGVDTDAAREAYKLGLKFIVARPCSDHGENFKGDAKVAYQKMLKIAHKVVLVNDQPYDSAGKADCLHARNRWMVDNCDAVVAIWDGSPSGTSNCVAYAKKANRPMIIINPNDLTTVYQGRKGKEDGRKYQYWASDKNEAADYGSQVDMAIVSLVNVLSTRQNANLWDSMKTEYRNVSGYWFDLCDGDTESHNKFFAWVESKGWSGISFLGGEDNKYVVTFGTKAIISRKSNVS